MTAAYFGVGGYGGGSASVLHADSANPDHIVVPDAQFLFTAHFHRAGPDLVLTGGDGHKLVIPEYFASEHHPALSAPNGASLSAHLVDLLAGSAAPNEYAQAGPITPPEPIGRCEKVVGTVTVIRNGVSVSLNVGDAVYKSDVVQTAANSSAGVAFPDGSALNLVANTRMALNEYSYDPNSNANSALFNLVEGGLSFVAGKVAHTGDMKIGTPIATMGIRGTAGWLYEDQVASITAQAGNVTLHFAAVFDGVTNTQSTYSLYAVDANGELMHDPNGNLIKLADVSSLQNGLVTTLTGQGVNALPQVNVAPPDLSQQQFQNIVVPQVINMAIQAIQQYQNQQNQQNNQTNPNSNPTSGSSSPPPSPPPTNSNPQIQNINLNNGTTLTITTFGSTPSGSSSPPPLQQTQQPPPTTTTTPTSPQQSFSWNPPSGSGPQQFNNGPDWQPPSSSTTPVPGPTDNVVDNSSTAMLVNDAETINQLTVGSGALVHVVGLTAPGSLTVTGAASVSGTITSDSTTDDPIITFQQGVTVAAGGMIDAVAADGRAAEIIFQGGVTIATGGEIEATGTGAAIEIIFGAVDDSGTILATNRGEITIGVPLTVESGATVEASGNGSSVITGNSVTLAAGATIEALNGASVTLDGGATIGAGAIVEASGNGASVFIKNVGGPEVGNAGVIEAADGGKVTIFDVQVENAGGTIEAMGADSMDLTTVTLSGSDIVGGKLETGSTGSSIFGEIVVGAGLEATFFDGSKSAGAVTIDAFVEVNSGASLDLVGAITDDGTINVVSGATLMLSGAVVDGDDGNSINVFGGGNIEVSASSTLDGGLVVNGFSGGLTVDNGATLTADDITFQSLDVTNNGTLQTDSGHTLKINGGTLDGGTIVDNGTIEISGSVTISDAVLEGTGQIIVDSGATLYLEDDGDTLDGVSITNHGNIQVDGPTPQTVLTLEGGATITDGPLSIGAQGIVAIATSASGPGATLTNVTVDNSGEIDVHGTLDLDGGTISGGTIDLTLGTASPQPIEIAVPDYYAIGPEVSANGQFVAFLASTSLPGQGDGDTNGLIELYNVAAGGQPIAISLLASPSHAGEVFGDVPSISDNGHLVLFEGKYSTDNGPSSEIFLYNSNAAPGSQVTLVRSGAGQAVLSGNGAVIAAEGNNTSGNSGTHILLMNDAGVVQTEITGDPSYVPPNNNSDNFGNVGSVYNPSLSDDGRYVAFWSTSSEIAIVGGPAFATGNTTGAAEVYIYDTLTHSLQEASGVIGGLQGNGDSGALSLNDDSSSWAPSLSGSGRFVVFQSTANNLVNDVGDAANDISNIFLYDGRNGTITAVTDANGVKVTGDSIRSTVSGDGKSITFSSDDSDLPGYNGGWQTYMVALDPVTGTLSAPQLLSAGFPGTDNGQNNLASSVSDGGGVTAFGGAVLAFNTDQGQATIGGGTITFSNLSLSDFDTSGDTLTLTISVAHGTLVTAGSGGTGQQTLTITGTLAQIDAALQTGVTYTPGSPPSASDTLSLHVTDQTSGAAASFVSTFNPTATDPSQIFSGQPTTTGQYDIFISEQQTINVTADTTIDGGAQIQGGLIALASGVTLTLDGITDTDTSIHDFTGTVAFTGSSTLDGTGIFGGTNQSGQPTGNITVGSGVTLILDDAVFKNEAVTVDSDGTTASFQIDLGHTFSWAGASTFGGPGSIIIDNNGRIIHDGTLDIGFTQVTFEGIGTVTQNGGNHGTEAQTLVNEGNKIDGYGTYGSLATIDNESGSFDADVAGHALVLQTGHTITNNGGFIADGGILKVLDAVTGTGSATIEHGGTLEIGNVNAQAVTFDGAGTLQLDQQQAGNTEAYTGTIHSVAAGDVLDLTGFGTGANDQFQLSTSYDSNTDTTTLTVTDTTLSNSPSSASILLSGDYTDPHDFSVASDGHGGIDVTAAAGASENIFTGSGDFFDGAHWSAGAAPNPGDTVAIASGAHPSFDQFENVTVDDITLQNSGELDVGVVSGAIVTLEDGAVIDGGALKIGANGEVVVGFSDNISPDATFTGGLTVSNAGELRIDSDATLALGSSLTLTGGGDVVLEDNSRIAEVSTGTFVTLDNVDNTVSGYGTIGNHDHNLTLTNETHGTIDANVAGETLSIDTADNSDASTLTNTGTLEAENGGELSVHSIVDDTGGTVSASGGFIDFLLGVSGGNATISGDGKIEYGWSSDVATTFNGDGTLVLDHQADNDPNVATASYTGVISGFGTGQDTIDVTDLAYSPTATPSWDSATGKLTIDNGTTTAEISLAGVYGPLSFELAPDSNGGTDVTVAPVDNFTEGAIGDPSNWFDSDNWSIELPTAKDQVVVSATLAEIFSGAAVAGSLDVNTNATLDVADSTLTVKYTAQNDSSIDLVADNAGIHASLYFGGDVINSGNISLSGDEVPFATSSNSESVTFEGSVNNSGSITLDADTNGDVGGAANLASALFEGAVTNTGTGAITVGAGTTALVASATFESDVENGGLLEATSGGTMQFLGATLANNGTLEADGGTLIVASSVSGSGGVTITGSGTADFQDALSQNVVFTGDGTLELSNPATFTGIISGIVASDQNQILDLGGLNANSTDTFVVTKSVEGGNTILTVTDQATGNHESVTLAGTAANGFNWTAEYDGAHGANVFDPPVTDTDGGLQLSDAHPPIALINDGQAIEIVGGVALHLDAPSSQTFVFGDAASSIFIDQPADFTGHIGNFTGTDAGHSDLVDLSGIDFNSAQFAETYHAATGVLSVTDGANSASFTFDNFQGALDFASDGHGGTAITDVPTDAAANPLSTATAQGTLSFADNDAASNLSTTVTPDGQNDVGHLTTGTVTESNGATSIDYGFSLGNDQINVAAGQTVTQSYQVSLTDAQNPAANATQTVAVTIGGAGNDNFVFAPGVGHDTVLNFNAQQDTVELDHFANAQTVQELQSLITADTHGNAVLDLGNHDSITFANTTQAQLQQAVQNGHVLLH